MGLIEPEEARKRARRQLREHLIRESEARRVGDEATVRLEFEAAARLVAVLLGSNGERAA